MSANPELDEIVALPVVEPAAEPTNGHRAELAVAQPEAAPIPAVAAPAKRSRPSWRGALAVGVVAIIASGSLGYLLYSTTQERNGTQVALAGTQTKLVSTQDELKVLEARDRYVAMYVQNQGSVQADYHTFMACTSFGACRTSSQQLLTDLGAFQSARKSADVPAELVSSDRDLGDALSSAYAADQAVINAMDNGTEAKFEAAVRKLNAAMLSVARAESRIGNELSL